MAILRYAAKPEVGLIEQARDGNLMLAAVGERIVDSRDFYAIFETDEEWRLVFAGRTLGTIPISNAVGVGTILAFAGRRWIVETVDDRAKVIEVASSPAGKVPKFESLSSESIHPELAREMLKVYQQDDTPNYLDNIAKRLLTEGRQAFTDYGLDTSPFIFDGKNTFVALWEGSEVISLVSVAFSMAGYECEPEEIGIILRDCSPEDVRAAARKISAAAFSSSDLASFVQNIRAAKYDEYVSEDLMRRLWAKRRQKAVPKVIEILKSLAA